MTNQTQPKILIADDDRELLRDLERVLKGEPFSTFFVRNAEDQIREARTGEYAFILTDLQMPNDEDGIYAIREITQHLDERSVTAIRRKKLNETIVDPLGDG